MVNRGLLKGVRKEIMSIRKVKKMKNSRKN